jgi:hypothetical protein
VSTTDPEAHAIKMADGGFRPAINAQLASDTKAQVLVGVDVSNSRSDHGKLVPMLEQMETRHGRAPQDVLVDGGFASVADIETASAERFDCTVHAPQMTPREARHRGESADGDSEAIAGWQSRMATPEAKEIDKQRAATAECANAQLRSRGLLRLLVRGVAKARAILALHALGHDLLREVALRQAALVAP